MKTKFLIFLLSIAILKQASGQEVSLDTLYKQAVQKTSAGDFNGATALYVAAQKIAEATGNTQMLCKIQLGFGKISLISENNDAVIEALAKAETYCTACKDTSSLAKVYLQRGILSIKQKEYDKAVAMFKQSSAAYLVKHDTLGAARAAAKIGNVLEVTGHYQEAQTYYLQMYDAFKDQPESVDYLTSNIYLTGNYHYLHQTEKAFFHNTIAMALARKLNANYEYSNTLQYEALIYDQMGQPQKAFDVLLNKYLPYYQDTMMNAQQLQEAEELKAKYESEKKEDQITLQHAEISRAQFRLWAVAAILGLAIIAGGLLFRLASRLRKSNQEKEFLIKEIHHRVKNNLQILSSLLHLQSRQITDNAALDAVREGQSRVDAMGLIHQKLYMGDNMARVEMKDYLQQFGHNMLDSFGIDDDRINIQYDLQPLYLDVDTAIPLGLIINELVTNSLKYAFPDERKGDITIALWQDDKNRLCLKVSDNGVGQINAPKDAKSTSFGANLVHMLSKKLKGKPEVLATESGYATQIIFEKID